MLTTVVAVLALVVAGVAIGVAFEVARQSRFAESTRKSQADTDVSLHRAHIQRMDALSARIAALESEVAKKADSRRKRKPDAKGVKS